MILIYQRLLEKIDELIRLKAKNPGAFLEKKDKASSSRIKEKRKEALKLFEEINSSDELIEKYSSEYRDEEGRKRTLDKGALLADHPDLVESQIEIIKSKIKDPSLD